MTLETVLARGRARARLRMTSRATIRRVVGRLPQDPATGRQAPKWSIILDDVPCYIAGATRDQSPSRTEVDGGVERTSSLRTLHLDADTTGLLDDDVAEITAGHTAGLVYRLVEVDPADQQTALRIPVERITRPEEWGPADG